MIQDICLFISAGSQFVHTAILPFCIEYTVWLDQAGNWSHHILRGQGLSTLFLEREGEFHPMVQSD